MAAQYEVLLTRGAEQDLAQLHAWISENRSVEQADALLEEILTVVETLAHYPDRGARPKELAGLGMPQFRQMLMAPYRILYRVIGAEVMILLIADGRRDMQSLLEQRLLR